MPPSINDYYGTRKGGFAKFIKTEGVAYRWQTKVAWLKSKQKPVTGLLKVTILMVFNNKRLNDVDNRLKCLFDALQIAEIIENDKNIITSNICKTYEKCPESYILLRIEGEQKENKLDDFKHLFNSVTI